MILFADNFQQYASTTQMLDGMWASLTNDLGSNLPSLVADPDPAAGGTQVLRHTNSIGGIAGAAWGKVRVALPTPWTTGGVAYRMYTTALGNADYTGHAIYFSDTNNTVQFSMYVKSNGAIAVWRSTPGDTTNGALLGETSVPVITANSWDLS